MHSVGKPKQYEAALPPPLLVSFHLAHPIRTEARRTEVLMCRFTVAHPPKQLFFFVAASSRAIGSRHGSTYRPHHSSHRTRRWTRSWRDRTWEESSLSRRKCSVVLLNGACRRIAALVVFLVTRNRYVGNCATFRRFSIFTNSASESVLFFGTNWSFPVTPEAPNGMHEWTKRKWAERRIQLFVLAMIAPTSAWVRVPYE